MNNRSNMVKVAVVGGDNKVTVRTIKLGPQFGDMWVVESGLRAGENVVVRHGSFLESLRIDAASASVEMRGALFEEGRRPLSLVLRCCTQTEVGGFERKALSGGRPSRLAVKSSIWRRSQTSSLTTRGRPQACTVA